MGANRPLPPGAQTDKARPRDQPSAAASLLSRDREGLWERRGEGRTEEGTPDPGTGGGLRRRAEPQEVRGAEKDAIDAAQGPMTSDLGRASIQ